MFKYYHSRNGTNHIAFLYGLLERGYNMVTYRNDDDDMLVYKQCHLQIVHLVMACMLVIEEPISYRQVCVCVGKCGTALFHLCTFSLG